MAPFLGTLIAPVLASAPAVGAEGALYYNSTSNTLFASDGAAWVAVGGSGGVTISDTAPSSPTAGQLWLNSTTLALAVYYDSQWVETGQGSTANITGSTPIKNLPWGRSGVLVTTTSSSPFRMAEAGTIVGVSLVCGTAPTGASIIVDVHKNGTTIFTNQANRPAIAASATAAAEVTNMDVTSLAVGDVLTVNIDQVGSTIAGADLTVLVRYQ